MRFAVTILLMTLTGAGVSVGVLYGQPQVVNTWPPLQGTPGLVYINAVGPVATAEQVVLGPGVQKPVKFQFGWIVSAAPVPPPVPPVPVPVVMSAGFIPLIMVPMVTGDTVERWCYPNVPNLDATIDGQLITRTINPAAIREQIQMSITDTSIGPLGDTVTYAFTVVPAQVLDGSGNEIRITPWWFRSDAACPGSNPGVALSVLPKSLPGIVYKRLQVLVLANW